MAAEPSIGNQTDALKAPKASLRLPPTRVEQLKDCLFYVVVLQKPTESGSPRDMVNQDMRKRFFADRCDEIPTADWTEFTQHAEDYVRNYADDAKRYQNLFRVESERRRAAQSQE
jgi:hypothetical protein